jgi:hypothetical protein
MVRIVEEGDYIIILSFMAFLGFLGFLAFSRTATPTLATAQTPTYVQVPSSLSHNQ